MDEVHGLVQVRSGTPLVSDLFEFFPVKWWASWCFLCQIPGTLTHTLECRLDFILIGRSRVGDEAGDALAEARDDNFFSTLNPIKKCPERVFGFEGPDFAG
jgi:hypothetical protein